MTSLLPIAFTKITPRPETLMLYFSAGSGKETRLQRQRTEGLVLTPITSQGKLRLAPGVLFSILRYLQGAINKLFPETEWDMKGTECWSHRKILRWKVCLKCVAPRILRCQGFTIIPGSTNCGPRVLHLELRHLNAKSSRPHEWSAHIAPLLYIADQFHCCYYKKRLKCNFYRVWGEAWKIFLKFRIPL